MDTKASRPKAATIVCALALAVGASPAFAQDPGLAEAEAKLREAATAVDAAVAEVQARQAQLESAREALAAAEKARDQAEDRLARTEAQAERGRITRRQVDADRQLAERALEAVVDARQKIQALESDMNVGQATLLAAKSAVDAARESVVAALGPDPQG